jgi:hypothetical protein
MKSLYVLLVSILLLCSPALTMSATITGTGGTSIASGTDLPTECTPATGPNAFFLDTNDNLLYYCSATNTFLPVGGTESDTLQSVITRGSEATSLDSEADSIKLGDGTNKVKAWWDPTSGWVVKPSPLGDTAWRCWTNYNCIIRDEEGDATILTIDPDATDNDKYTWSSGYRPIKTLSFTADALYPQGGAAVITNSALVSGGLVAPYITVTDSDSTGFYRYVVMPPTWDGGTVTATVTVVNVNATPANTFEVDVSGACYPSGTLIPTTISTTGEQPATVTFGASGSCGASACNQNDPASATTAAITINGTPAGGNFCGFQAQVDATATTETVTGIKVVQMDIHYKIAKGM